MKMRERTIKKENGEYAFGVNHEIAACSTFLFVPSIDNLLKRVKIIIKQNQRKLSTKDIDEQSQFTKVTSSNTVHTHHN